MPKVAVYLVTYRRPALLRRALGSVLAQTEADFLVRVVNDDPADPEPARIVAEAADPRVSLFRPLAHRGGADNFNLMFSEAEAPFVSLLEDDNWWEPAFLETMLDALAANPGHAVAVGNELIWQEFPEGGWRETDRTIWPFSDTREHRFAIEEICGSAKIANSALLIRLGDHDLRTPDGIPVDITEHYRERALARDVLLVGRALVNFAVTRATYRSTQGATWGVHQTLLIGSVFAAAPPGRARRVLAERLWRACPSPQSPRAVSLVAAGASIREARALLVAAPRRAFPRFALWVMRRPGQFLAHTAARRTHAREFAFLTSAPLTRRLAAELAP